MSDIAIGVDGVASLERALFWSILSGIFFVDPLIRKYETEDTEAFSCFTALVWCVNSGSCTLRNVKGAYLVLIV